MPEAFEGNYDDYREENSESKKEEIDAAINDARTDLDNFQSEVFGSGFNSINEFYRLEGEDLVYQLNKVKNYLVSVSQRLQGMKIQKFGEVSKENNFKGTILAIKIALKAMETDSKNPIKYNIGKINGEYDEATIQAIKQFQTDNNLTWKDGKPGKETIGKLVEKFGNLIDNKKEEVNEQNKLKSDITNIIEESYRSSAFLGFLESNQKEGVIDYIMEGNLGTKRNAGIESQLSNLSQSFMNWKLKYLIEHSKEPLKDSIAKIKEEESRRMERLSGDLASLKQGLESNKEIVQEGGSNISEAMFQELLKMEGGQGYTAQIHRSVGENFVTGPYGMVYKHIDSQGKLLKKAIPFMNGERVTKEWALSNAKAYYNKRAKEWKNLLDGQGFQYNQNQLDSLVSASGGKQKSVERLKDFVVSNWDDKNKIFDYLSNFATRGSNGKVLGGLVARRQLEAHWFMGETDKSYTEYQKEYQQRKHPKKNK